MAVPVVPAHAASVRASARADPAPPRPAPRRPFPVVPFLMCSPAVVILLLVGLYPLLFAVAVSFQKYQLTRPHNPENGTFLWFANYLSAFRDPQFWGALGRSGFFLLVTQVLEVFLGVAIALFLDQARLRPLRAVAQVLLVIPIAMTPAVVGLIGRLVYDRDFGLLNYLLSWLHVPPQSWLGQPGPAMISLIMTDVWQWTPFMALVALSGLAIVPRELLEAARLDSHGWLPTIRHVQLPYLLPGITVVLIIRTADVLKLFDMPYVLTRGGPGVSTELISLYVQRVGFRVFDLGLASAQAIVLLVICTVLSRVYFGLLYRDVESVH